MQITYTGERFELTFRSGNDFFVDLNAAKNSGFKFEVEARKWWTKDAALASRLVGNPDTTATPEAAKAIELYQSQTAVALEQSRATSADVEIPVPNGLAYLPYQKAGILYALRKFGDVDAD